MSGDLIDDKSIRSESALWRRIQPDQIVTDDNTGVRRPSSSAFSNSSDNSGMSVILGDQVLSEGRTPHSTMELYPDNFLASITAGLARENGQIVIREPIKDEPAHAEVCGEKSKGVKRTFAKNSIWIVSPPPVELNSE